VGGHSIIWPVRKSGQSRSREAETRMAFIRTIHPEEATGSLARQYDQAIARAGRVFNIVSLQSLNPTVLDASIRLYKALMLGPGTLSRPVREMLATVTSRELGCFY